jgi:hypothetical protein
MPSKASEKNPPARIKRVGWLFVGVDGAEN